MADHVTLCDGYSGVVPRLQIDCRQPGGGALVCTVAGEIDLVTAPTFLRALSSAEHSAASPLVLDLSRVELLSAIGVGMVIDAAQRAADDRRWFALVVTTALVQRVLDLTGASGELTCRRSVDEALSAYQDGSHGELSRR